MSAVLAVALAASPWVTTWSTAPDGPGPAFKAQTLKTTVRVSAGGSAVRIRLSNLFGAKPITLGPVHLDGTPVFFGGKPTVRIAKGESAVSDAVELAVAALQPVTIDLYCPTDTGPSTQHGTAFDSTFVSDGGAEEYVTARFFLTDVEVSAPAQAIVAFGDSITDGFKSTVDAHASWPDVLAARLNGSVAVINEGISGNRVLTEGAGPSALKRFDRDVLGKPGAHWVIVLEGINDIGQANIEKAEVSAQQIIDGLKALAAAAKKKGLVVIGATLTPFGGCEWPFHSAAGEKKRQAINAWVRAPGSFDAVIDFDLATRDAEHPDRLVKSLDSGDHLHPNDAGYRRMAEAIDLSVFTGNRTH